MFMDNILKLYCFFCLGEVWKDNHLKRDILNYNIYNDSQGHGTETAKLSLPYSLYHWPTRGTEVLIVR